MDSKKARSIRGDRGVLKVICRRGGIVYDFNLPGDPRTPGWASVPGGRFLAGRDRGINADDRCGATVV